MQDKRRWLPSWQRVELVELCLEQGFSRREAAEFRHVSVSTVQWRHAVPAAGHRRRPLDLIETRTFGSRVIYERYVRDGDGSHERRRRLAATQREA